MHTEPSEVAAIDREPATRIEQLKRQLAEELKAVLRDAQGRLDEIDAQIDALAGKRREVADETKAHRAELARLTGERPAPKSSATGEHACKHCDRTFPTKQGLSMHNTRSHKADIKLVRASAPSSSTSSSRTVFRCGEVDCGSEFRAPADLSHHTLTVHRRQPTQAEKILVTPDR